MIREIILLDSHVSGGRGCYGRWSVKPDQDWMQPAVGRSLRRIAGSFFLPAERINLNLCREKSLLGCRRQWGSNSVNGSRGSVLIPPEYFCFPGIGGEC